jgi:hypothetical protein
VTVEEEFRSLDVFRVGLRAPATLAGFLTTWIYGTTFFTLTQ